VLAVVRQLLRIGAPRAAKQAAIAKTKRVTAELLDRDAADAADEYRDDGALARRSDTISTATSTSTSRRATTTTRDRNDNNNNDDDEIDDFVVDDDENNDARRHLSTYRSLQQREAQRIDEAVVVAATSAIGAGLLAPINSATTTTQYHHRHHHHLLRRRNAARGSGDDDDDIDVNGRPTTLDDVQVINNSKRVGMFDMTYLGFFCSFFFSIRCAHVFRRQFDDDERRNVDGDQQRISATVVDDPTTTAKRSDNGFAKSGTQMTTLNC
jgi:hypothetical protein